MFLTNDFLIYGQSNNKSLIRRTEDKVMEIKKCIKCGACAAGCPMGCIKEGEAKYEIDSNVCIECGACAASCPVGAPKLG